MAETLFGREERGHPREGGVYVRVAVERGIEGAGELTYWSPQVVIVGQRVNVPLGRKDKPAGGIVVAVGGEELLDGFAPDRVKSLLAAGTAHLPEPMLELGRWMSRYYVCPLGMALATMMPAAVKRRAGRRVVTELTPAESPETPPDLTPSARRAWEAIRAMPPGAFPLSPRNLAARIGEKTLGAINRLIRAGLLLEADRETVREAGPPRSLYVEADHPVELTPAQDRIVQGIGAGMDAFGVHLLRGVTGSGKTEIYLRLIDRVLHMKGSALVLVPEISLTPQTAARFEARFREHGVVTLHSGLSATQRHAAWARAASGSARVVVGARSAVFAPLSRLALIVVDEEHDASYKQDQVPRYNARDVAVMRGRIENCPVLLGSATPSLESWANARADRYRLWELPDRVGAGSLPPVEIVDMREERRARAELGGDRDASLGPTLQHAIAETLRDNGQVILLVNRRGFAHYLACPNARCGWVMTCDHCDAGMVLHLGRSLPKGGVVRCHHCLAEQRVPAVCPVCGLAVSRLGAGTQRLEDELARTFGPGTLEPGRTMLRIDSDSMRSGRDYADALARFGRGEVRLLLGTQMIAKGLDFPGVTLVGVVSADTALAMPDFRAAERTFQLVSQVAGRAGRGERPGRVIVQTWEPNAPPIRHAAAHDYPAFAEEELHQRGIARLPPATRMVRIVCRDEDSAKAGEAARALADALRESGGRSVRVEGPMPCPISRIAGHYRFAVEAYGPTAASIQSMLAAARSAGLLLSDAKTAIDVDPVALM
ncbi:MAG: primosomal protein N' [Leptolyngbya sp. PLA2]|nr:primosomal protein N' [Leptolyngbya sp. PL-A2]MCQ3940175.1 primosomal protein N' [cyanobacterium CYA1]MCZ7632700.1 primosomal protein N' [Phycisphaerales bacterium]MDL1904088.1 primosomal protein N' [Synechococcales cyanobacterium CNB]GIK20160.1 MAG: primosomal protein N' [Planctomycetota bacterium]